MFKDIEKREYVIRVKLGSKIYEYLAPHSYVAALSIDLDDVSGDESLNEFMFMGYEEYESTEDMQAKIKLPNGDITILDIVSIINPFDYEHKATKYILNLLLDNQEVLSRNYEPPKATKKSKIATQKKSNKKVENKMNFSKKMNIKGLENVGQKLDGMFAMSLLGGGVGVKLKNGNDGFYTYDSEKKDITDVSAMAMELPLPAIAMPEQVDNLQVGDILLEENEAVFVIETGKNEIKTLDGQGKIVLVKPVKNSIMPNVNFVTKVMNLAESMNFGGDGDSDQANPFGNNPLMMMALLGDSDSDSSDLLTMMMMGQMFNPNTKK